MTWILTMTVMMWTGSGTYEAKRVEYPYQTEAACLKAKEAALSKVSESGQGVIAKCSAR